VSVWLVFLLGGLATFALRFSFIYAFGRVSVPPALHRALRFVPPAVLSAIVFPELLTPAGHLDASPGNHRLLAGLLAVSVAAWTRRTLTTIIAGMAALFLLGLL
jgi:branched-subunit amino acid transport protein